jgi:hypothetical protein
MSHSEPKNEGTHGTGSKPAVKKPYQKPEVRHERVFETMALQCGKVNSTQGSCRFNRKAS